MKEKKILEIFIPVFTAIALFVCGVSRAYAKGGRETPVGKVADFFVRPMQSAFTDVQTKVSEWMGSVTDAKAYRAENERLKEEIASMEREMRETVSLQAENRRLLALLQLQEELSEIHKTHACRVIARDAGGITGIFHIDKGERDGIRRDDTVICSEGLVGRVTAVYENSAQVTPITDEKHSVGVRIVRNQELGVAESRKAGIVLSCFSEETVAAQGDEIETSGVGGIYPAGIFLGTVSEVTAEITLIAPAANIRGLQEVLVLCRD